MLAIATAQVTRQPHYATARTRTLLSKHGMVEHALTKAATAPLPAAKQTTSMLAQAIADVTQQPRYATA
jgi:hypothetical protein